MLQEVGIASFVVHFRFDGPHFTGIGVDGRWELRDASGAISNYSADGTPHPARQGFDALDATVVRATVASPTSIRLEFDSGHALTLFSEQPGCESIHLYPLDLHF